MSIKRGELIEISIDQIGLNNPYFLSDFIDERYSNVKLYKRRGPEPVAYTYGLLFVKPRVVIGEMLLDEGWASQLKSVLEHEYNHIQRLDIYYALVLNTYSHCFLGILNLVNRSLSVLSLIPFVGTFIYSLFLIIMNAILSVWNFFLALIKLSSRKSELLADLGTKGYGNYDNLIIALRDLSRGTLGYYHYSNPRLISQEIINEFVKRNNFIPQSLIKKLGEMFQNKSEHPGVKERIYWANYYSDYLESDAVIPKVNIVNCVGVLLVVAVFSLLSVDIKKSIEFEYTNKELINYMKELRK
ncbi:M48 family metalloprotease [Halobacteriovorax sp.]|uniref:M48 family metalloprotease n=1 Tax=Halobacteriovorax sp. TaxID=2020862 RepID=UPI003AF28F34